MTPLLVLAPPLPPSGPERLLALFENASPPGALDIYRLDRFEPRSLWRLRGRPIVAWGPDAVWPALLAAPPSRLRLVSPLPRQGRPSLALAWVLRRCAAVVAAGPAEAARLRQLGVREDRLHVAPPAVELRPAVAPASLPGLPADASVLLAVGPLRRGNGQREAVWAFDILAFLHERLHLVVAAPAQTPSDCYRFAEATRRGPRLHLLGEVDDLAPWLARADVVLALGRAGGRGVVLEAMAAGRPIVATRTADHADLIDHERTGLLAGVGDLPDVCRQIRSLLTDAERGRRLADAARQEARRFTPAAFAEAMNAALGSRVVY